MKKIIAFASAAALGLSLTACGDAAEEIEDSAGAGDEGVVLSDAEADAMVDEAADDGGAMAEEPAAEEEAEAM